MFFVPFMVGLGTFSISVLLVTRLGVRVQFKNPRTEAQGYISVPLGELDQVEAELVLGNQAIQFSLQATSFEPGQE